MWGGCSERERRRILKRRRIELDRPHRTADTSKPIGRRPTPDATKGAVTTAVTAPFVVPQVGESFVSITSSRLVGSFVLLPLGQAVLELLLRLAEVLGQLRQLRAAEQDEHHDDDQDDLGRIEESEHARRR